MGFTPHQALFALGQCGGDQNMALDWLFEHIDEVPEPEPESEPEPEPEPEDLSRVKGSPHMAALRALHGWDGAWYGDGSSKQERKEEENKAALKLREEAPRWASPNRNPNPSSNPNTNPNHNPNPNTNPNPNPNPNPDSNPNPTSRFSAF